MRFAEKVIMSLGIQLIFLSAVMGQSDNALDKIHHRFEQSNSTEFKEKIFVHVDRGFYVTGEIMWFKLYVLDEKFHQAADLSKVAYLEVMDNTNKAVLQAKVVLKKGIGNGSFYLPLSLKSGNYKIRAYTNWMKNFSVNGYFEQAVTIVNTFLVPEQPKTQAENDFDVRFFPEGGNMVAGIRSKVAFRAVGKDGKGIAFKAAVTNQNEDTVAILEPLKNGIGHFIFTPAENHTYKAILKIGSDSVGFPLPDVLQQGYVMQVNEDNSGRLNVSVAANSPSEEMVYLVAHSKNAVKVAEPKKLENGKTNFSISKEALDEGISCLTVFDQDLRPVAERLFFKYPEQLLELAIQTAKPTYSAREKVELVYSTLINGEPVASDLSLAVFKLDSMNSKVTGNILSYLWLTSELKGNIESPEEYFETKDPVVAEAMDNLMLTHGWRRFTWDDVQQPKAPKLSFIPEYEGHIIKGIVTDKQTGSPVPGVKTFLSVPGRLVQFYASKSDEKGEFIFVTENLYGPKEMVLQTQYHDSLYDFRLEAPFSNDSSSFTFPVFELSTKNQESLRSRHIQMQVQNMYWEDQINNYLAPAVDSFPSWGPPDKRYLLDDYTRFPTMEEVMREFIYEVRVRKDNGKFKFMLFNPKSEKFYLENPLVLLDGVPVFDIDKIVSYNPLKVESVEVFDGKYNLGGDLLFPGIVSYKTYKGDLAGFPLPSNHLKVAYEGMQFKREFFQPVYEQNREEGKRMPDFRSLLFWAPDLKTDATGQEKINFYTSDIPGQYLIVLQGISKEGKAGYQTFKFKVENSL